MPVDAYNASIILKCLHTYYAQNFADIIYLPLVLMPYFVSLSSSMLVSYICDRIWENPPYGICVRFAQCLFLVAQVEICQSPDFVIYMSNNPSFNCCRLLQRLVIVLYEGEISLPFDPSSRTAAVHGARCYGC